MHPITAFLITWLLNALALWVTAAIVPGVRIRRFSGAIWGALALGFVAFFIRPLVVFFSLPFLLVTLGLFYVVILGFCFWLAAKMVSDFEVDGLFSGFLGALVLGLVNWGLSFFLSGTAWS